MTMSRDLLLNIVRSITTDVRVENLQVDSILLPHNVLRNLVLKQEIPVPVQCSICIAQFTECSGVGVPR